MHEALPDGCPHIDWVWDDTDSVPGVGDPRGRLVTQFATWTCPAGGEPVELPVRRTELEAQGLAMTGEPHLCQTSLDTGSELWAVALDVL